MDQQSAIIPFIVLKLLLSHRDTIVDVGRTVSFVSAGSTIICCCIPWDAKAKISSTETLKYVLKCDCHLRGRLPSCLARRNLHHPLAGPWQSGVGNFSVLLPRLCLSWMWCRTLLSHPVCRVPFRSTVFTSTSAHMNYCLLNNKSNKFSPIQRKPQW